MLLAFGISFGDTSWWGAALIATVVLGWLLLRAYGRTRDAHPQLRYAKWLKAIGMLLLILCFLEPSFIFTKPKTGENLMLVVADNSRSLTIQDEGQDAPRGEAVRAFLERKDRDWQEQMEEEFGVRRYTFDSRLRRTPGFEDMAFTGNASDLVKSLATLRDRYKDRALAGIVLVTDGNATDAEGLDELMADLPPVYPVVFKAHEPERDLAVSAVMVNQTAFEDAPVTLKFDAAIHGYKGKPVEVRVLDEAGRIQKKQDFTATKNKAEETFSFQMRPDVGQVSFFTVDIREKIEDPEVPPLKEATSENNRQSVSVDRSGGPYQILYVAGRPNWEFKFLNRALAEDRQIRLVGLLRIAKREPKFQYGGRRGETSNPIFRGYAAKRDAETESYDQPVIIRLNTVSDEELRDGFPTTAEGLFPYHAIIVDDLESAFFTREQMTLIQKFVAQRGGGFLMLGGQETFQEGDYQKTPVESLLPVYLDKMPSQDGPQYVRMNLSREGWMEPWLRLRDNENAERMRLQKMPDFRVLNRFKSVKPGAQVLATARNASKVEFPLLTVQRMGHGRSAALAAGDLWRWGMRDAANRADMEKLWRQLARWLVTDVPERVDLKMAKHHGQVNKPVALQVQVHDEDYSPKDNATIEVEVKDASGKTIVLTPEASLEQRGLFEARYVPRAGGGYLATARVRDANGDLIGESTLGWAANLTGAEYRSLEVNRPLLKKLAQKTGGRVLKPEGMEAFVSGLMKEEMPVMEPRVVSLWHTPWFFMVAVGCFVAEWWLRRKHGVA